MSDLACTIMLPRDLFDRLVKMAQSRHMSVEALAADLLLEQVEVHECITDTEPSGVRGDAADRPPSYPRV